MDTTAYPLRQGKQSNMSTASTARKNTSVTSHPRCHHSRIIDALPSFAYYRYRYLSDTLPISIQFRYLIDIYAVLLILKQYRHI